MSIYSKLTIRIPKDIQDALDQQVVMFNRFTEAEAEFEAHKAAKPVVEDDAADSDEPASDEVRDYWTHYRYLEGHVGVTQAGFVAACRVVAFWWKNTGDIPF